MTTNEIRQKYLDFFKAQKHKVIPRANLVPQEDPTTLFTGSGMQPLLPYLLGEKHPSGKRLIDSQPAFRAEDIEEIGDNRHTTFFEMLGNWSLGDYFKKEQTTWLWEFLIKELKLDPAKIYITVFAGDEQNGIPKDDESVEIWQKLFAKRKVMAKAVKLGDSGTASKKGMQGGRIFYYDAAKNWWSRAGIPKNMPAGEPGGPDSEVFYEFTQIKHDKSFGEKCHPNCDCGRFLEICNSVFMQYVKQDDGSFIELPQQNVDFGGGLERIAAAVNDNPDIFKTNNIWPIIERLCQITGKTYEDHVEAKRVVADHMRSAVFMAVDGVRPSNQAQGYVLRRLVRRAVRKGHELGINQSLIEAVVPSVVGIYEETYPEIKEHQSEITEILVKEETVFKQTLKRGLKEFRTMTKAFTIGESIIGGDDTIGGPVPINIEKLTGELIFRLYDTYGFPPELSVEEANNRDIAVDKNWQSDFDKAMEEQRERSRTAAKGDFAGGLGGHEAIHRKYHTATHLMYKALRMTLGDHVMQKGSNITDERLRFDFTHPEKMTPEQIKQVEDIVNEQITADLPVSWQELPTKEALKQGAFGAFGDKYGESVKVYSAGKPGEAPFSFEICGGPHVEHTGELAEDGKSFKIAKEESSSAGVRRIKAVLQ